MKIKMTTLLLALTSISAFAGDCVITVDRIACPGKERDAYIPYNEKNPTRNKKFARNLAACLAYAVKEAKIIREGTLAEKNVHATFDGKAITPASDKKECH